MPANRTSAKPASREDAGPYKHRYSLRKAIASNDASETTDDNHASTSRAAADNGPPPAKVPRERCTKEQTAALEEFYNLHGGSPTPEQKEELAARINKSYHSTEVWFRNRRAKKGKATASQQTVVHATVDPGTDTTPSNDTMIYEYTTPEHPEQPVKALAAPLVRSQKAKKPRGRATRLTNAKAAISGPTRAKRERATKPSFMPTRSSSPGINNIPANGILILDDRQAPGDSNSSVFQPPKSTPPAVARTSVAVPWMLTEPKHALEKYPVKAQTAARMMTKMHAMTQNPHTVAGKIFSDSPDLYEPWAFPLPSASKRRTTRSRSQKGDVGEWRDNGEEKIYHVVPHMVPESWMAGPSRNDKARHPWISLSTPPFHLFIGPQIPRFLSRAAGFVLHPTF